MKFKFETFGNKPNSISANEKKVVLFNYLLIGTKNLILKDIKLTNNDTFPEVVINWEESGVNKSQEMHVNLFMRMIWKFHYSYGNY